MNTKPNHPAMRRSNVTTALVFVLTFLLAGCSTTQRPISNSLLDITGESRVTKLKSRDFPWYYTLFEQRDAFAVNGLLQMPDVGQLYFYPGKGDPTAAIGVAQGQSYKLVGESELPGSTDVENVRTNLDAYQSWVVRTAVLDAEMKSLEARLLDLSTNGSLNAAGDALKSSLKTSLDDLRIEQKSAQTNRTNSQVRLRDALKPGIILARWQAADSGSLSVNALPTAKASVEATRGKSGFVILGGVRFVAIVYGEDFWWALNNLRAHEKSYVRNFGVTTYLIQAQNVAYSAEMDLSRVLNFAAKVDVKNPKVSVPTSVEVRAAIEQLANFGNQGTLNKITWKREPYCFVCGPDLPDLTTNACDQSIQRFFHAQNAWGSPTTNGVPQPSFQNWRTVVARVAHLGWFPAHWKRPWGLFGKKVWEEYEDKRPMHGAPTCPVCAGQTNAVIPGLNQPRSTNHCEPVLGKPAAPTAPKVGDSK